MTREERLFAIMRRWSAINAVLDQLRPGQREALIDLFSGLSLQESAKRIKVTKERARQLRMSGLKIAMDMLLEDSAFSVDAGK